MQIASILGRNCRKLFPNLGEDQQKKVFPHSGFISVQILDFLFTP